MFELKLFSVDSRLGMNFFSSTSSNRTQNLSLSFLCFHTHQSSTRKKNPTTIYAWTDPSPTFSSTCSRLSVIIKSYLLECPPLFSTLSICSPIALCYSLQMDNIQTASHREQSQLTKHPPYFRKHLHWVFMEPCKGESQVMFEWDRHYFWVFYRSQNPLT